MSHRDYVWWAFTKFRDKTNLKNGKVLDVGCQQPFFREKFGLYKFEWTGCDKFGDGRVVKKCLMEDMSNIPDCYYDLVFVCHSWEHCERPIDALREFMRVLKSGGWLFIATPNPCQRQITDGDEDHIFVLLPVQMNKLLVYTGWSEVETYLQTEGIGKEQDWNVISIAKKKKV